MFGQSNTPFGSAGGFGQNTAPGFGAPSPGGLFGASAPAPAFGSAASTPAFGSSTPAFGSPAPAFGSPAPAFGSAFGAPAPSTGLFGSAPAAGGFGAPTFGSPAPAPFGAPASGGLFGSSAAPATGFGSPSPGLFGAPASTASPFGQSSTTFGAAPTSTFGSTGGFGSTSSTFGAQAPSTGLFGAPAPSTFGAPATAPFGAPTPFGGSTFGSPAPATTSLFGAPAPSPAGGLFGAQQQQAGGSRITPFQITNKQDGTSNIALHSISAMPQYEHKSFEELRYEDYSQGNRGTAATPATTGFGGFGAPAPAPSTGLFGAAAPAPFGAPSSTPFGSPTTTTFGSTAPTFGAAPAPFGSPAPAPFGAPAPSGGLFGTSTSTFGSAFGSTNAPASGGLFGSSQAPAAFGSTAPAPFGAPGPFGAPAPSAFGSAATAPSGGLFGSPPAPAPFGSTSGGLFGTTPAPAPFGAPAPSGGLFGSTPAPAPFGAAAPTTSLFGATAPGGSAFSFGARAPSTGLFGASTPAPAPFGSFGAPAPFPAAPAPTFFGAPPAPPPQQVFPALPPNANIIPQSTNEVLIHQLRALEKEKKEWEKVDTLKGKFATSSGPSTTPFGQNEPESMLSRPTYSPYVVNTPMSSVRIRPRGFFPESSSKPKTPPITPLGRDHRGFLSPEAHARSSALNLVVKPDSTKRLTQPRFQRLILEDVESSPAGFPGDTVQSPPKDEASLSPKASAFTLSQQQKDQKLLSVQQQQRRQEQEQPQPYAKVPAPVDPGFEYYQQVIGTTGDAGASETATPIVANKALLSAVPKLTKSGYEVNPSLEDLKMMSEADLAAVAGFAVKRPGYGMVEWEGAVDVRGADLDSIVTIEHRTVEVYTSEEEKGTKPPVGSKLNRSAVITCFNVFPKTGGADASEEEKEKYAEKVARITRKIGAELVSYDKETGVWKIRVQHFSRYTLNEDDDEDGATQTLPSRAKDILSFKRDLQPKLMQTARSQSQIPIQNDLSDEITPSVSKVEMTVPTLMNDRVRTEAEIISLELEEKLRHGRSEDSMEWTVPSADVVATSFEDEGGETFDTSPEFESAFVPDHESMQHALSSYFSICCRLAEKAKVTSSSVDFGLKMKHSFRVGWLPDGSFLKLNDDRKSPCLVQCRPCLMGGRKTNVLSNMLESQLKYAQPCAGKNSHEPPLFSLPHCRKDPEGLRQSLLEFSELGDADMDVKYSFRLLSRLLLSAASEKIDEPMRVFTAHNFFVELCGQDIRDDIDEAKIHKDTISAIFSAVSGGDVHKACHVAAEFSHLHLLTSLAVGIEGRKDIQVQLMDLTERGVASKITPATLRLIKALSCDTKFEDASCRQGQNDLDWRKRLAMRLWQTSSEDLAYVLQEYEEKVLGREAPFPCPRYLSPHAEPLSQDLLFKLLKMCANLTNDITDIISPAGFTPYKHDFSTAFHLACAVRAVKNSSSVNAIDSEHLLYGYEFQLINAGLWEWAVFVSLWNMSNLSSKDRKSKLRRARSIVHRHFDGNNSKSREFLERRIGVPAIWLAEAVSYRSVADYDILSYIHTTMAFDEESARSLLEETYLPNIFFRNNRDEIGKAMKLFENMSCRKEDCLTMAMHRYFLMIDSFDSCMKDREEGNVERSVDLLSTVECSLRSHQKRTEARSSCGLAFVKDPTSPSSSAMISTALKNLYTMRLQMECRTMKGPA